LIRLNSGLCFWWTSLVLVAVDEVMVYVSFWSGLTLSLSLDPTDLHLSLLVARQLDCVVVTLPAFRVGKSRHDLIGRILLLLATLN
jgi:hypothetical protein